MIINKIGYDNSFKGKLKINNLIPKRKFSSTGDNISRLPEENKSSIKDKIQKYAKKASDFIIRFLDTL